MFMQARRRPSLKKMAKRLIMPMGQSFHLLLIRIPYYDVQKCNSVIFHEVKVAESLLIHQDFKIVSHAILNNLAHLVEKVLHCHYTFENHKIRNPYYDF